MTENQDDKWFLARIEDLIEELPPEIVTGVKIEKDLQKGFDYRRITVS